jgi:hypothetical protein
MCLQTHISKSRCGGTRQGLYLAAVSLMVFHKFQHESKQSRDSDQDRDDRAHVARQPPLPCSLIVRIIDGASVSGLRNRR